MNDERIPIFYSCDENFMRYRIVSIVSLMENASPEHNYRIHILHTDISPERQNEVLELANGVFEIVFEDVTEYLASIAHRLPLRDYYTKTTYFRLFIAEMHKEYGKAIYIDCDTVVKGDISELYSIDISDYCVAAAREQVMNQVDVFGEYAEKCVGVQRGTYFNAGVLLMNCAQLRERLILDRFIGCLMSYEFSVTQDEDYLNLLLKDHVLILDPKWNTEVFGEIPCAPGDAKIIHYIMFSKPWRYEECPLADIFFDYAKKTPYYESFLEERAAYTDEKKARDGANYQSLEQLARHEATSPNNYLNSLNRKSRAADRVEILKKIAEYERAGRFDEDVENDPPSRVLRAEEIDYIPKGFIKWIKTKLAVKMAHIFVHKLEKKRLFNVKEIRGIEHLDGLQSGAVITCNHFNAFDSFAIQIAYEASKQRKRKFFRVIREGNYTSFPGFYGFLMRNCNTLPLSSSYKTMKKFMDATNKLLSDGNLVLVYPEQSMWWNYRKPKPLKNGAFFFAVKSNVPVLPCFITMRDSDVMGDDGFYVQEYTIHISEPLYPDASLPAAKRSEDLRRRNYKAWADVYESVYQVPLEYTTEHPVEDLEYLKNPEFYEKKASEKGDAGLSLF